MLGDGARLPERQTHQGYQALTPPASLLQRRCLSADAAGDEEYAWAPASHTSSRIGHKESATYSGCTRASTGLTRLRLCQKIGIHTAEVPGISVADPVTKPADSAGHCSLSRAIR